VVNPDTSQIALHYSGGYTVNNAFVGCVNPGQRELHSVNEQYFYYPHGQRTFEFRTGTDGGIAPAAEDRDLLIGTKGIGGQPGPQAHVSGAITLQLVEDCRPFTDGRHQYWPGGPLQKFNDTIGRQAKIYVDQPDTEPDAAAWNAFLTNYIGGPVSKAMNASALGYTLDELYGDSNKRDQFVRSVELGSDGTPGTGELQRLIDQQMGGHFIDVLNVQIGQPTPPQPILDQLVASQVQQQQAANAKAAQDAASQFGGVDQYLSYLQRKSQIDNTNAIATATAKALNEGRAIPIPVPAGSPVMVGAR
jgi:hypothetical protein